MLQVLTWWLLAQLLGLAALPLAFRLFKWLPDRGYAFGKPLGLLLTSYILWMGGSLGYLHNTLGGAVFALAAAALLSVAYYVWRDDPSSPSLWAFLRRRARLVLTLEALFTAGFLAWITLRAYAPDKIMSAGGEKFMEIAFLNAILRSPSFPPHDPWLSGFAISYYYFGYVMMALLTRLSGALSAVGFELYDALTFAFTLTGAFGVVYNLVAGGSRYHPDEGHAPAYGVLGAVFVGVMGNLEGLLEALYARELLPNAFWEWIDIPDLTTAGRVTGSLYPGDGWWWWRASRVIRDRNLVGEPMPLNPIDEFPYFSFLLGDNHPHVLALPFVLMAIALALNLLRRQRATGRQAVPDGTVSRLNRVLSAFGGDRSMFVLYALALGALGFLNTWDFPIYVVLIVFAFVAGQWTRGKKNLDNLILHAALFGIAIILAGIVLYLPFYISFSSQAGGVVPYLLAPTRLPQYLVMFGPFVFVVVVFVASRLLALPQRRRTAQALGRWWLVFGAAPAVLLVLAVSLAVLTPPGQELLSRLLSRPEIQQAVGSTGPAGAVRAVLAARLRDPWLFIVLSLLISGAAVSIIPPPGRDESGGTGGTGNEDSTSSVQFASLLILCGLGLTFATEFVYLRDTFGVRMNTIFKFYYQGWVMLGCAAGYAVWWMLHRPRPALRPGLQRAFLVMTVLLTGSGIVYTVLAGYARVDGFSHPPDLNGAAPIARAHPDDWAAIERLGAHAQDDAVILEAPGKSYNYEGRISAFTGYQAVLGWALHESQWRGNYVQQGMREPDIATIYTTPDARLAVELLSKWDVDYVVVGAPERQFVEDLCAEQERRCGAGNGLAKFDVFLQPVFTAGQTTVYRVPVR